MDSLGSLELKVRGYEIDRWKRVPLSNLLRSPNMRGGNSQYETTPGLSDFSPTKVFWLYVANMVAS